MTGINIVPVQIKKDFNPHSRTGSDNIFGDALCNTVISIHTPARGVTLHPEDRIVYHDISIHTPARGVTNAPPGALFFCNISIHTPARVVTIFFALPSRANDISIHTPARGVTVQLKKKTGGQNISIHTPARGVTRLTSINRPVGANFNPHSRTGSDPGVCPEYIIFLEFQSTLPHGE